MQFAVPIPAWALALIAIAVVVAAWACYAGALVPLERRRRLVLTSLRATTLVLIVLCLLRPVRVIPPAQEDAIVPVLVDASRSMGLADAGGRKRIDAAAELMSRLTPPLGERFRTEVWTFGETLQRLESEPIDATQRQSDLAGALRAVHDRYRDRRVAGIVVLSDGGDTSPVEAAGAVQEGHAPIYTVGFGAARVDSDFEVLDVTAGEVALAGSSVDVTASVVARGASGPFDVRLLENGRPIDVQQARAGDGGPVPVVFTVSPPRDIPAVYTVEIAARSSELVLENNRRSVLIEPPGRRRRVLMIEGAPGFEHAFIKRALTTDAGIELDSVVRKGQDARGDATYFVQADGARAPRLATGFPQERAALFEYDAIILANMEADALSRAQLEMLAGFVDVRGGGLLLLGARSFAQQAYAGTPIDELLPLHPTGRGAGVVRVSAGGPGGVQLTPAGNAHPVMRIAAGEENLKRWSSLPALAGVTALGGLRPGAEALALVNGPDGKRPLIAVQRYGQGRAMVFTGEASWRWRMRMPSTDRTHELFWRQAVRWIAGGAPPPVMTTVQVGSGGSISVSVDLHDGDFNAIPDGTVDLRVTHPDGHVEDVDARVETPQAGRYVASLKLETPGIYRVAASATRGGTGVGAHERWVLVGGVDPEMADPRLNQEVLKRVAAVSGGTYVDASDGMRIPELLASTAPPPAAPRLEELWHTGWMFAGIVMLLAAEWVLRRQWGLR
jgi:uncharacterized membrane protein